MTRPWRRRPRRRRSPLQKALRLPALAIAHALLAPGLRLVEWIGLGPLCIRLVLRLGGSPSWVRGWRGYEPTARDVVVGSYFKSGTNWTLQIAQQIAWRGQAEFDHIHDVVAWPDQVKKRYAVPLTDPGPAAASPTGLRVIKTHAPWSSIPYSPSAHYILVVRDPKDVVVSGYHFIRGVALGPIMPSVETWVESFLSPKFFADWWPRHAQGYWSQRTRANVLFLTFKEMKEDLPGVVARIARHMGVDLTPEEMKRVVEKSGFEYMRSVDAKFAPGALTALSVIGAPLIRSGRQGGAAELLSTAQQERIDRCFRAALIEMGSDLDYDSVASPPSAPTHP